MTTMMMMMMMMMRRRRRRRRGTTTTTTTMMMVVIRMITITVAITITFVVFILVVLAYPMVLPHIQSLEKTSTIRSQERQRLAVIGCALVTLLRSPSLVARVTVTHRTSWFFWCYTMVLSTCGIQGSYLQSIAHPVRNLHFPCKTCWPSNIPRPIAHQLTLDLHSTHHALNVHSFFKRGTCSRTSILCSIIFWPTTRENIWGEIYPQNMNSKSANQYNWHTLPETNIAPENRPSQKESHIPTIHF